MRDLQHHVEDLDHRGRRHNLRVCGLPESVDTDQLSSAVMGIFNNLLDGPLTTPIEIERMHRALRHRVRENEPPRVVVCCIVNYQLKEEILRKAHNRIQLTHGGAAINIYQHHTPASQGFAPPAGDFTH